MAGPWLTEEALKQHVADTLKKPVADLKASWDRHIALALADGYNDIVGILLGKGFTMSQLDAWDSRVTYNRQQSTFWALVYGMQLGDATDVDRNKLDRRKDLTLASTIMINGAAVAPGADDDASGIGGGYISEDDYRINSDTEF